MKTLLIVNIIILAVLAVAFTILFYLLLIANKKLEKNEQISREKEGKDKDEKSCK